MRTSELAERYGAKPTQARYDALIDGIKASDKSIVSVVRCKECKWWEEKCAGLFGYCGACKHLFFSDSWEIQIRRTTRAEFFCADGELPGEDDEG